LASNSTANLTSNSASSPTSKSIGGEVASHI